MNRLNFLPLSVVLLVVLLIGFNVQTSDKHNEPQSVVESETDIEEVEREQRSSLRAFAGAPPIIPHEVTPRSNDECLHCHTNVRELGLRTSLKTPHTNFSNCMQCHVRSKVSDGSKLIEVKSSWKGLEEGGPGTKAHFMAPPTIPHHLRLREDCATCHSKDSPYQILQFDHPERSNCQQCHVMASNP